MTIIQGLWTVLKSAGLLVLLACLVFAVLATSCLASMFAGNRSSSAQ